MQQVSGGTWGGCVYDVDAIVAHLRAAGPGSPEGGLQQQVVDLR